MGFHQGKIADIKQTTASFDINASSTTDDFLVQFEKYVAFQAIQSTGEWGSATVCLQESLDEVNWFDVAGSTLSAAGMVTNLLVTTDAVRAKVGALAATVGTVEILIEAK